MSLQRPQAWTSNYRVVASASDTTGPAVTDSTWVVEDGRPDAVPRLKGRSPGLCGSGLTQPGPTGTPHEPGDRLMLSAMAINLGPTENLLVLLVLLLPFGAKERPELARGSGRALRIFTSETKGLLDEDPGTSGNLQS